MVPIRTSVLVKQKNVRTIKLDVVYSPAYLQGMRFKNIYTRLGAIHCALIIQFYGTDTDLGQPLQTTLEYMSMDLGLSKCLFQYDYKIYSYN